MEKVTGFGEQVLMTFVNEYVGYLLISDFDGYCGGDVQQFWRKRQARVCIAKDEMFRPSAEHRRRMLEGWGSPRFDADVWSFD